MVVSDSLRCSTALVAGPVSFLSVILLLTSAALIATYLPARRVTTVDPMITMRYD